MPKKIKPSKADDMFYEIKHSEHGASTESLIAWAEQEIIEYKKFIKLLKGKKK